MYVFRSSPVQWHHPDTFLFRWDGPFKWQKFGWLVLLSFYLLSGAAHHSEKLWAAEGGWGGGINVMVQLSSLMMNEEYFNWHLHWKKTGFVHFVYWETWANMCASFIFMRAPCVGARCTGSHTQSWMMQKLKRGEGGRNGGGEERERVWF